MSYVSGNAIKQEFQISTTTLHNWEASGKIETIRPNNGGKRLYNPDTVNKLFGVEQKETKKSRITYARVSSLKQKPDLERQINALQEKYPEEEILSDIGSGLNWNLGRIQKHYSGHVHMDTLK